MNGCKYFLQSKCLPSSSFFFFFLIVNTRTYGWSALITKFFYFKNSICDSKTRLQSLECLMNTFEWSSVLGIKFTSWFYKSNNIYHIEIFFFGNILYLGKNWSQVKRESIKRKVTFVLRGTLFCFWQWMKRNRILGKFWEALRLCHNFLFHFFAKKDEFIAHRW